MYDICYVTVFATRQPVLKRKVIATMSSEKKNVTPNDAKEVSAKAKETVEEIKKDVVDQVENASEDAEAAVSEAKDTVSESVEDLKIFADDVVQKVKDAVADTKDDVLDSDAAEKVEDITETISEEIKEAVSKIEDTVSKGVDGAEKKDSAPAKDEDPSRVSYVSGLDTGVVTPVNFAKVAAGLFAVVLGWKFVAGKKRKRKEKKLDKVKATVTKRPVKFLRRLKKH